MFISPCLNHNYNSAHLSVRECREVESGSSVPCVDAFRIALTEEPKWFIQQKHGQNRQLSILLLSSDTKPFSFWYVGNTDKDLKSLYIVSNKSAANIQIRAKKASLQPAVNQQVVKLFQKGAWLDSKRALVRLWKSTCCKPIRPLLEAKRACIVLYCMKTVYKYRW